jgi:hypothetical protein
MANYLICPIPNGETGSNPKMDQKEFNLGLKKSLKNPRNDPPKTRPSSKVNSLRKPAAKELEEKSHRSLS